MRRTSLLPLALFVGVLGAVGAFALAPMTARTARADDPPKPDKPDKPDAPDPAEANRGKVGYGTGLIEALTADERKQNGIEREKGMYVTAVTMGSPAAQAGMKLGDVILKVNGRDAPDTTGVDTKDKEGWAKFMKEKFGPLIADIKPGDVVTIVVDRAGRTETLKPKAVSVAELKRLEDEALEDAGANKVPDPREAGTPTAGAYAFEEAEEEDQHPDAFFEVRGYSGLATEAGATPPNHYLRLHTDVPGEWQFTVASGAGRAYRDGTASARFLLLGGEKSASGGLAFRVKGWKDFYAAVADGVSKTFQIVSVQNKAVKVLATTEIASPKLRTWHTIAVTYAGRKLEAVLDGATKLAAEDGTFAEGYVGPCVREDADTGFDDLKLEPK